MGTLHSITTNQDAIKTLFRVTRDAAGNLRNMPAVFPDCKAPVVRAAGGERELIKMLWDASPPRHGGTKTNIRDPTSPH